MTDPLVHPELAEHIRVTPLADTHEHQHTEKQWIENGPADVLVDFLETYVTVDLFGAQCGQEALDQGRLHPEVDLRTRWAALSPAWDRIRDTGYGEAMAIQAREVYGIEEITPEAMEAAQPVLDSLRKPGERLRLLKDVANIDHVQIDGGPVLPPDPAGPDFFLHDISWYTYCIGAPNLEVLSKQSGEEVCDLASYRRALHGIFERDAHAAVGVKSQHAYARTLRWEAREDADAERVLRRLATGKDLTDAEKLCLGDWSWARGVEFAMECGLPFKMHTGFYAGANNMIVDRIRSGHLCTLAVAYPKAKLVCMHMAYPYESELVAMCKQFENVYADMCWAWSINPYAGLEFVRKFLHGAAANKLFVFGGDTGYPTGALAYAFQARKWLARTLSMEVRDGLMSLDRAKRVATDLMWRNQRECFPVDRAQETARRAAAAGAAG